MPSPRKSRKTKRVSVPEPEILEMKSQKMAVVHSKGNPNRVLRKVLPALYGSVFTLKFDLKPKGIAFKGGGLRGRWPDANLLPKDQWTGILGLSVPADTASLPQKVPHMQVKHETWEYGTVAQILHIGPFKMEGPTVKRLHQFIADSGYEIAGVHEEEYLTSPRAKAQKTLIRYSVKKKAA